MNVYWGSLGAFWVGDSSKMYFFNAVDKRAGECTPKNSVILNSAVVCTLEELYQALTLIKESKA